MNPREITDFLENTWFERRGVVAAVVLVSAGLFPLIFGQVGALVAIVSTIVVDGAIIGLWYWSQRPPVTRPDRIGFLVSISCTDDDESKKLQEDFIRPLRELIKSGSTGQFFHFLELPQHIASKILDVEQAHALRIQCKAHFMIYGRVRLRQINGKDTHVLDLEGAVAHTPVPEDISKALALEFSELMPRRLHVSTENDLLAFQFTSEWTDAVARYIIGLACAVSGDWDYAETLFLDVKARLHSHNTNFPIYIKLKERLPQRLSEIHHARARSSYRMWVESKDEAFLELTEASLQKLAAGQQDLPEVLHLKAILAFVLRRNAADAIAMIKKIKAPQSLQWHLNMAFLLGYQGELRNAVRHYRLAEKYAPDPDTVGQVEEFIVWVLQKEPNRFQLYYCLGFFNWKIKGDRVQASRDFASFLSSPIPPSMLKEKELATKWIEEMREKRERKAD